MAKSVQYDGAQDAAATDDNEVRLRSRQQLGFVRGFRQEKLSDVDAMFDAGHSRQATWLRSEVPLQFSSLCTVRACLQTTIRWLW